ncbi:hypothetical protein FPY71_10155 [Aureimonas fodinaquatilis]|uniref:Uncharacterized protein n=1 Tax=Aureimonas fodinaquatilis TaxID=2565783 RepID=A0A5B0E026_9HYPH|nr:hypothetical protein [Aureimonas fodinaquatilis]KAA0970829.1 hypothetical protein FPY71_10155 [Aureimonas fodinaquatilis]
MHYEVGKSFAWFVAFGRGYAAEYAFPGNRRTRMLSKDGKIVVFPTYAEAIAAAQLKVRKHCEPDIRVDRGEQPEEHVPAFLNPETWAKERAMNQSIERRTVFRGLGKGSITVETRRRGI